MVDKVKVMSENKFDYTVLYSPLTIEELKEASPHRKINVEANKEIYLTKKGNMVNVSFIKDNIFIFNIYIDIRKKELLSINFNQILNWLNEKESGFVSLVSESVEKWLNAKEGGVSIRVNNMSKNFTLSKDYIDKIVTILRGS